MKKNFSVILIILGSALLVYCGYFFGRDYYLRNQQQTAVSYVKKHMKGHVSGQKYHVLVHNFDYNAAWNAFRDGIIQKYGVGTLEIPAAKISLPILEGVSDSKMAVGVVTVKPNQVAGERNYALAGHNMTARGNLLHNLQYVSVGNFVKIQTKRGLFTYEITDVHHNWPQSQGDIIDDSQGNKIVTIYTCDNAQMDNSGNTTKSIYVRGKLISQR